MARERHHRVRGVLPAALQADTAGSQRDLAAARVHCQPRVRPAVGGEALPVMGEALRKRRHGTGRRSGQSWYVDETYLKVHGRWCYLYRAIDRDGNLIDTMLSATRDMRAAQRFFRSARSVAGFVPDRVTTDGHNSYPRAIRSTLGRRVRHRTSVYPNNRLEQDHRGIKGRIRCMRGFKEHEAADRFCREHDELRNFRRSRSRHNQYIPAARRRRHFLHNARIAIGVMQIA